MSSRYRFVATNLVAVALSATGVVAQPSLVDAVYRTSLNTNLVLNGGAELGDASSDGNYAVSVPGWSTTYNFTVVKYGTAGGFPTVCDAYFDKVKRKILYM